MQSLLVRAVAAILDAHHRVLRLGQPGPGDLRLHGRAGQTRRQRDDPRDQITMPHDASH